MTKSSGHKQRASIDDTHERLPPSRAFLVQLPAGDLGGRPTSGRVEHVQSGRSTRFDDLERLAEFFAQVLADDEGGERRSGEP